MNNEDLIDDWDNEDYEVFNQWDEEAKNKKLEELEKYFESDMEISKGLIDRIKRQDKEIYKWKWQKELLIKRDKEHQEEIEDLKAKLEMYENGVYFSSENDKLQQRIDKAIEYVKSKKAIINTDYIRIFDLFEIDEQGYTDELLNILQGSDKE